MTYPVTLTVVPALTNRNRLTTFFRFLLAIPHIILVGGAGIGFISYSEDSSSTTSVGEGGLLGAVAGFLSVISWFTIVIAGTHIVGIRQFCSFYLRWRTRAGAYLMLLEDPYPPFGDAPYPTTVDIVDPGPRNRLTVLFRLILVLPHFFVVFFLFIAWCLTTVLAWFVILFTGAYPQGMYEFGTGVLRWMVRVEAYMLLLVDEYPPFSLT